MKNITFFSLLLMLVATVASAQSQEVYFVQLWEQQGFENPESVVVDEKNQMIYVSNINGAMTDKDGNGYISKISTAGSLVAKKWVEGLNAPKGMAVYKNHLYVADIDQIVDIDIEKGEIIHRFTVEKATFLNDVTVDKKGRVFVSNTFGVSAIFKLEKNVVNLWFETENLPMPNGLLAEKDNLLVVNYGVGLDQTNFSTKTPGSVYKISLSTKQFEAVTQPLGNLDGIAATVHGYVISDWLAGKIFYWSGSTVKEALQLSSGTADLSFSKDSRTMFVPFMKDGKVVAYSIKLKQ